ncbi:hypothetical protein AAVH_13829 [Aphelenchoides avenae]|nr:hypothetical protein AAVH_13829 [Aphelenchus avenae]
MAALWILPFCLTVFVQAEPDERGVFYMPSVVKPYKGIVFDYSTVGQRPQEGDEVKRVQPEFGSVNLTVPTSVLKMTNTGKNTVLFRAKSTDSSHLEVKGDDSGKLAPGEVHSFELTCHFSFSSLDENRSYKAFEYLDIEFTTDASFDHTDHASFKEHGVKVWRKIITVHCGYVLPVEQEKAEKARQRMLRAEEL